MLFSDLYYTAKSIYKIRETAQRKEIEDLQKEVYMLCFLLQDGQGYRTPEWYKAVEEALKRNGLL
jgi:hypothetical protein